MNDSKFIELLTKAGDFKLKSSTDVDDLIVSNIHNMSIPEKRNTWITGVFNPVFFRPVLAVSLFVFFIFFVIGRININRNKIKPEELYNRIISQIKEINVTKDIGKAMDIYADDFFKHNNKNDVKKNIESLFESYADIQYEPVKEKIIMEDNRALIENKIKYQAKAYDRGTMPIIYQGKERIYLERCKDQWKIVAWLYDDASADNYK